MKGDLVRRSQGLAPSLTYFNRALEVDPNIEALLQHAATLGDLKREPQARADLKRINDLVPGSPARAISKPCSKRVPGSTKRRGT